MLLCLAGCTTVSRKDASQAGLWRFIVEDRYGYIDKTGRTAIPAKYANAGSFSEGLAFVELPDGRRGYIRANGTLAFSFENENGDCCQYFHEGLAPVRRGGKNGFINPTGEVVIPPRFDAAYQFSQGCAPVKLDDSWGIIDRNGKWIVEPSFQLLSPYSEGLSVAVTHDKKWGYLDTKGETAIPFRFTFATDFHGGLALVADSEGRQFINKTGQVVHRIPSHLRVIRPFFDGSLAAAQDTKTKRWGYVNKSLERILPYQYEDCSDFSEGLAAVLIDGKWGYINTQGVLAIPPRFTECQDFKNGHARVSLSEDDNMWRGSGAIIDRDGQIICHIPPG